MTVVPVRGMPRTIRGRSTGASSTSGWCLDVVVNLHRRPSALVASSRTRSRPNGVKTGEVLSSSRMSCSPSRQESESISVRPVRWAASLKHVVGGGDVVVFAHCVVSSMFRGSDREVSAVDGDAGAGDVARRRRYTGTAPRRRSPAGVPGRPSGVWKPISTSITSGMPMAGCVIRVSMRPGATALTRMPSSAQRRERFMVSAIRPILDEA